MDALLKLFCCRCCCCCFRKEVELEKTTITNKQHNKRCYAYFEMSKMLGIRGKMRSAERCVGIETFALHCILFYGQTTNNDLKLLVNFFVADRSLDGRIGVDFYITEVVFEFIVSFDFLTLPLSLSLSISTSVSPLFSHSSPRLQ